MSEPVYKVRAIEKLYYIDDLKIPGNKRRDGSPADEFCLVKKEDFNADLMEPIGWVPQGLKKENSLLYKEDGTKRTQVEIANIKSDQLDKEIRDGKVAQVEAEEKEFREKAAPKKEKVKL